MTYWMGPRVSTNTVFGLLTNRQVVEKDVEVLFNLSQESQKE